MSLKLTKHYCFSPHLEQNCASFSIGVPHFLQKACLGFGVPQCEQNSPLTRISYIKLNNNKTTIKSAKTIKNN